MYCRSYCEHGGRCVLTPEHPGLHDSLYCQWPDDRALAKDAADVALADKPGGTEYLETGDRLLSLLELFDNESEKE